MGKLNLGAVQQKNAELQQSGNGGNYGFDKLESGKNVRRILPPKGDREVFWSEGFMHYSLGADGKTAVTCLSTFDKKCPICEYLESIQNSKNKDDQEMIKSCRKTKRIFIAVLNRDSQDEEEKPLVLGIGKSILKGITDCICDPDYGDITDFETGRDITITKSGTGMQTSYTVLPKPKSIIASDSYSPEELDELIPDLDSLFVEKSPEELEAILNGEEYGEEEESDDDELDYDEMSLDDLKYLCKDRGIRVPAGAKRSKLVQLLIEYDESGEDEEDEEEQPAPKGRKGAKGAMNPPEEDDDEDESDEEEDDENDDLIKNVRKNIRNKSGKK